MSKEEIIIHPEQSEMFTDELRDHIDPIVKGITVNNCHLVAKALYDLNPEIAEKLNLELTAQDYYGTKVKRNG